jgi:peptidoglycan hydrolase CwlO-like protein
MSTLGEITKEKQRLGEALARLDAQRDKLTSQLTELEATERVLARYSKRTQTTKTRSGKSPTTATQAAAPARQSAPRRTTIAKPAGVRRSRRA